MLWLNFLHLYQPANSNDVNIHEAVKNCYAFILETLNKNEKIKFSLNIQGCLLLRLDELGYKNIINGFKKLINRGQVEITGTAAYHPIIPLIPEKEINKQVSENKKIYFKYFGHKIKIKGFFFPEMAYNLRVGKIIKKLGYEWTILDEINYGGYDKIDNAKIYKDFNGLKIIFRSRELSNSYVPEKILKLLKKNKNNKIIITATDSEIYGLRHRDNDNNLSKLITNNKIDTSTISSYLENKEYEKIKVREASWESEEQELKKLMPFYIWNNKNNKVQTALWELANFSYKIVEKNEKEKNYSWARWHLVRGLSSCTFWWASGHDFKKVFGPIAWNPDEIIKNATELIKSVRSLSHIQTEVKISAEKLYAKIINIVWETHWSKYNY